MRSAFSLRQVSSLPYCFHSFHNSSSRPSYTHQHANFLACRFFLRQVREQHDPLTQALTGGRIFDDLMPFFLLLPFLILGLTWTTPLHSLAALWGLYGAKGPSVTVILAQPNHPGTRTQSSCSATHGRKSPDFGIAPHRQCRPGLHAYE
jgi:hypothetical protein